MWGREALFVDRLDAGRKLAARLEQIPLQGPLVLALPRGGVPVAFEIAKELHAPLDILLVRKIGAPGNPEYGIGAVVDGSNPQIVLNEDAMAIADLSPAYIEREKQRQLEEIERRRAYYLDGRPPMPLKGRSVIIVDDGIATGGTVKVAIKAVKQAGAAQIILAVPVAPPSVLASLREEVDEIICLEAPEPFYAVGQFYEIFGQTTDEEVVALLHEARLFPADAGS